MSERGTITPAQYDVLLRPLNTVRVAKRSGGGGKQLSYLEAWDVRAHLIRVFGFGNFDVEAEEVDLLFERNKKMGNGNDGWEVAYRAAVRLTVRTPHGVTICTHREVAIGSADGSSGLGDLHDNAAKQAVSDAVKRCAINLGSAFGLSLYDGGSTRDVVGRSVSPPEGWVAPPPAEQTPEQKAALAGAVGQPEEPNPDHTED